jgi:hypothetical protein
MMRWLIVIVTLSLLFSSCDKCKLESQQTLQIYYSQPVIHNTGIWSSTPGAVIADDMIGNIRSQFREPEQLLLLQSSTRYVVTIDSISCASVQTTETVGDPCWKSEGWLHDMLHPQTYSTWTLNTASLHIYFTIKDTLTNLEKTFSSAGYDGEYLYLPPADSLNCYSYEKRGTYDMTTIRNNASYGAYCDFKCIIRDWLGQ